MNLRRRLRGIIGTALTWAAAFGVVTTGLSLVSLLALKNGIALPWRLLGGAVLVWSLWGLMSGAIYAGLLVALERKRTLSELSPRRLAIWGVIAGAISPLSPFLIVLASGGMTINWQVVAIMCASGATVGLLSAQLSLRAARGRFYTVPLPSSPSLPRELYVESPD